MTKNDWDNPDTWAHIPEFDVKPSEVEFKGFSDFVFGPETDTNLSENLIDLIRIARKLVRKEFKTLKDVHQSNLTAWDLLEIPDEVLNQTQRAGIIYQLVMMSIGQVCSHSTSAEIKINAMASAGSSVAMWAADGSAMALKRISQAQANRRIGKTKLSDSQKRQIIREHEAAVVRYGTIKSLAGKFNVTVNTIRSTVKKNDSKRD